MVSVSNKRVVGRTDTSYMNIGSITQFKLLTGGDYISVEKKGENKFTHKFRLQEYNTTTYWVCQHFFNKIY